MPDPPIIAIVDDTQAVREALSELLQMMGYICRAFDGAAAFLDSYAPGRFACLITDVRMPGMSGIDLQQRLTALGAVLPIIFITSHDDPVTRARALDGGACAFLTKPVADDLLLEALIQALGRG